MGKLISIRLLELLVNCYDFLTLPIYFLLQQPWRVRQEATKLRAKRVQDNTWVNTDSQLDKSNRRSVDTLDELFRDSVATYARRNCLGVRKILALEYRTDPSKSNGASAVQNGATGSKAKPSTEQSRVISKYVLADKYTWYTYKQIDEIVTKLSAGLIDLCDDSITNLDGTRKILICADTCMQWFLTAHACFRNNITVVTAYTTLDDDAVLHIIQQTEVKILVVSQKFSNRLPKIIEQTPQVDTIIILDEPLPGEVDKISSLKESLIDKTGVKHIYSYNKLIERGEKCEENISSIPKAEDIAVLMYTSGSTGKAKGVMLSHKSIVYTALSFSGPGDLSHEDRYIGYLPLGHVLELAAECIFLRNGSTIAYSSPFTLTNASPMIKKGQYGDAYIFRPTIMGTVPLVLDRIKSGIQQTVKNQGEFYDQLINDFVVRYKRYWWDRYYDTPIMNFLICRKFNMILGGRIRAICSGGAALSRDTQEYLRHVTNYTVIQGYGLTETSAAASFSDIHDRRYNVVGAPYPIVHIKLESWSDYSVDDKPYPRGEIIVGGQPVSSGYYKMDELTNEAFFVDPKTGIRYFRTGDIGMMLPDGVLKIVDRKKDIVKPLSGEYISLSEIEVNLRTLPVVENICVYCSQYSNYVVALIRPEISELKAIAAKLYANEINSELADKFRKSIVKEYAASASTNIAPSSPPSSKSILERINLASLCSNKWLTEYVLKLIQDEGAKRKLKRTHVPSRVKIVCEDWSPESGLVTASFKLRRREIEKFYAEDIRQMYAELGQKIDQNI